MSPCMTGGCTGHCGLHNHQSKYLYPGGSQPRSCIDASHDRLRQREAVGENPTEVYLGHVRAWECTQQAKPMNMWPSHRQETRGLYNSGTEAIGRIKIAILVAHCQKSHKSIPVVRGVGHFDGWAGSVRFCNHPIGEQISLLHSWKETRGGDWTSL